MSGAGIPEPGTTKVTVNVSEIAYGLSWTGTDVNGNEVFGGSVRRAFPAGGTIDAAIKVLEDLRRYEKVSGN